MAAASGVASKALVDLDKRLREMLRQARLTHIDAVIGKKKKLEIEIANLREGRYPADLFATLQLEGLMGDDEEYWPFEGEYWSDEYENYKLALAWDGSSSHGLARLSWRDLSPRCAGG